MSTSTYSTTATTGADSWNEWIRTEPISLDRIEVTPGQTLPPFTQWGQEPLPAQDASTADMFEWVRDYDDYRMVVNTLKDGWNQPSPELFLHWYHAEVNARIAKRRADEEREVAEVLFQRMKDNDLDKTLDSFISQKVWYPGCSVAATIPVFPNVVPSPRNPPSRRYKTVPKAPRRPKGPKCHKCRQIGHIRQTCPTRQRHQN